MLMIHKLNLYFKEKSLWELMEPYPDREQQVFNFVTDVKPNIILETVKIFDPFGPTITDPNLQCIIVSKETKAGGDQVNEERLKRVCIILKKIFQLWIFS